MNQRVTLPSAVAKVFITDQLYDRVPPVPDYLREKLAIQDLAAQMSEGPGEFLSRLVKLAMEICAAQSGGISVLEPESRQFRWLALCGALATFENATTPRDNSPCGVCLDHGGPVLMAHPERAYDWIRDASITVPEVLLVPLRIKGEDAIGTLWIVAGQSHYFDSGHARVMTELASFAGVALRMIQTETRLKAALQQQETLTGEMSHRVKNLFALVDGMIRMTARSAETPADMAAALTGRLHALAAAHGLVRRSFVENARETTDLHELAETILRPHNGAHEIDGPAVLLGQHAATDLALVFHELATNAAKYGSLKEGGAVTVGWRLADATVHIDWAERGGPHITGTPRRKGFGTTLAERTLGGRLGGTIAYDWSHVGLRVAMTVMAERLAK
jgi:two-component sensor histidine kinase